MNNGSPLTEIIDFNTIFSLKYNQMLIGKDIFGKLKDDLAIFNIIHSIIITRFKDKILIRFVTISISW